MSFLKRIYLINIFILIIKIKKIQHKYTHIIYFINDTEKVLKILKHFFRNYINIGNIKKKIIVNIVDFNCINKH